MSFATPAILSKPPSSASSLSQPLAPSAGDMTAIPTSAPPSATPSTSHSREPSLGPSVSQVSSVNGSNPATPPPQPANGAGVDGAVAGESNIPSPNSNSCSSAPPSPADVDRQIIIEALKSKDRIYVLKLGEQMESLIKERRPRVDLTPATSYQRLLVHRCSAYYKLAPENDPITKAILVRITSESRIPDVRICELVPPESSSQPTFKIMRRSPPDRLAKPHSQAGSVAGEDADLSDVEPSEAGSLGGRSNATGSSTKKHMTIEEREAAYKEARSRIFNGFEEKEKAKESQLSASSSSLSVNSTSASTSANGDTSSVGDADGCVSSPATESEWSAPSGPVHKERKDYRRGNASTSSSSRSVRSGGASYGSNNSSRNSRASSPSFTYASLYEPPPPAQLYDPNQPANAYQGTQYYHPFTPPTQPQGGMYVSYSSYYPPYPYQAPAPDPHHAAAESSVPRPMEHYQPQPPPVGYGGPYMWQPPAPAPSAPHSLPTSPHHTHPPPTHSMSPPPPPVHQYSYPPYGYPAHGYYPSPPPQGQVMPPPPQGTPGMQGPMYEVPRAPGGPPTQPIGGSTGTPPYPSPYPQNGRNSAGNGAAPPHNAPRSAQRSQIVPGNGNNNGNKRNTPPNGRNPWSYGPGISSGGYNLPSSAAASDTVGPRLNASRRQSNNSSSSSYSRASSNNDDVSSIASSSTTSSSSRRTYTSTTSSQHPLPPRPDWAVGLKAQPTLARDTGSRHTSGPISPSRSVNGSNQGLRGTPPLSLQAHDFPPLTPMAASQERRHVPNGAWGNAPNRTILSPPGGTRSDDIERYGSERPSPKSAELYNPKLNRRVDASGLAKDGETQCNLNLTEQLVNQIQSFTIEEKIAAVELASSPSMMAPDVPSSSATGLSA